MSACGVADSAELDILTKALNDYCARHHIADKDGRVLAQKKRGRRPAPPLSYWEDKLN